MRRAPPARPSYASGSAVDLTLDDRDAHGVRGVVRREARTVATVQSGADDAVTLAVGRTVVRLERRGGEQWGLRAVDRAGREHREAVGHREGDLVDWVLPGPGGELRLRQHLGTTPSRRTLLDRWGRAWATTDDIDRRRWSAQLPPELDDLTTVFCLLLLVHVDGLGLDHSYGNGGNGGDGAATWSPVQGVAVRPALRTPPQNALLAALT